MKLSVFLTGASGFLGRHILDALAGYDVATLVRPAGDLARPEGYAERLRERVVIHAAATAPAWGPYGSCRARSAELTRALVGACVAHGARRLVLISAAEVYGAGLAGVVTEEAPARPRGQLCADAHLDAERIARDSRLDVVVLRAALCYGRHDRRFVPRLVADLRAGRSAILGDGTARPVLCDATRLAACAVAAMTGPAGVYNVADQDSSMSWGELMNAAHARLRAPGKLRRVPAWLASAATSFEPVLHGLGLGEPALTRHVLEIFSCTHRLSVEKARRDLGWEPRADAATGLLEQVESCP